MGAPVSILGGGRVGLLRHCERVCRLLRNFFKFALLLFTTWSSILNTRSLAALVAITQNVFPARWLRPENSNLWSRQSPPLENVSRPAMSNPRPACGPVSVSLFCTACTIRHAVQNNEKNENVQYSWLYLYSHKFEIFDAMVFSACLLYACKGTLRTGRFSRVQWHLGHRCRTDFYSCSSSALNWFLTTLVFPSGLNLPMA